MAEGRSVDGDDKDSGDEALEPSDESQSVRRLGCYPMLA